MEWIGTRIRRQRLRLGLTLDELSAQTAISKPYLSTIENGRTRNPPSDEKLRSLERALGLAPDMLLTHARLLRTPPEVLLMLEQMIAGRGVDAPIDQLMREILRPQRIGDA
jgi:transcriptional regulator with XRE-family HTH domain